MMGSRQVEQGALFYNFSLEGHVPADHLLRAVDRFVDFSGLRRELASFYNSTGRPSVDPELMIRILIIRYGLSIRYERRLCDEVHLNLAYRWFCRLELDGAVPDHSTSSRNRYGRFRDSDLLRRVRCADENATKGVGQPLWPVASLRRRTVHEGALCRLYPKHGGGAGELLRKL